MMGKGGPAFPQLQFEVDQFSDRHTEATGGMTLRDYLAAAALTGLLANSYNDGENKPLSLATRLDMAEMAYWQADEMLKVRAK